MRLAVLLCLLLSSTSYGQVALGPDSPPPGTSRQAWSRVWERATKATKQAFGGLTEKQRECGMFPVLVTLWSRIAVMPHFTRGGRLTQEPLFDERQRPHAREAFDKYEKDKCKDDDNGPGTPLGLAWRSFTDARPDWESSSDFGPPLFPGLAPNQMGVAGEAVKAGSVLVPAARGAVAAPAGTALPLLLNGEQVDALNPRRRSHDGT